MQTPDNTRVDYEKLLAIANAAVFEMVSPSAKSNLTDDIAAKAVEQYLAAVAAGQQIENPYGWIQVTARRRAIDSVRKWERHKIDTVRIGTRETGGLYVGSVTQQMSSALEGDFGDPAQAVVAREWIADLIDTVFPDDEVNRRIAMACVVGEARPRDLVDELGLTNKVIGNRLVRIRERLREEVTRDDLHRG